MSPTARYLIGIAVPFLSVIPTVPLLGTLQITVFGVPLALLWLFACIPITSLCLAICWFGYDRHRPNPEFGLECDSGDSL